MFFIVNIICYFGAALCLYGSDLQDDPNALALDEMNKFLGDIQNDLRLSKKLIRDIHHQGIGLNTVEAVATLTTVPSARVGNVTISESPPGITQEALRIKSNENLTYFTDGLDDFWNEILMKDNDHLREIMAHFPKNYVDAVSSGRLAWLNDQLRSELVNSLPFDGYHTGEISRMKENVKMRKERMSPNRNKIFDMANNIMKKEDGDKLKDALKDFHDYPDGNKTPELICRDLFNAFVTPFERSKYSKEFYSLKESIDMLYSGYHGIQELPYRRQLRGAGTLSYVRAFKNADIFMENIQNDIKNSINILNDIEVGDSDNRTRLFPKRNNPFMKIRKRATIDPCVSTKKQSKTTGVLLKKTQVYTKKAQTIKNIIKQKASFSTKSTVLIKNTVETSKKTHLMAKKTNATKKTVRTTKVMRLTTKKTTTPNSQLNKIMKEAPPHSPADPQPKNNKASVTEEFDKGPLEPTVQIPMAHTTAKPKKKTTKFDKVKKIIEIEDEILETDEKQSEIDIQQKLINSKKNNPKKPSDDKATISTTTEATRSKVNETKNVHNTEIVLNETNNQLNKTESNFDNNIREMILKAENTLDENQKQEEPKFEIDNDEMKINEGKIDENETETNLNETNHEPYFSFGYETLLKHIALKDPGDVSAVLKYAQHIIDELLKVDYFHWLGPVITYVLKVTAKIFSNSPIDDLQDRTATAHGIMRNRDHEYDENTNEILNYADSLVEPEDGEYLYETLEDFKKFPNVQKTGEQMCEDLIDAFQRPFKKLQGTQELKDLINASTAVMQVFNPELYSLRRDMQDDGLRDSIFLPKRGPRRRWSKPILSRKASRTRKELHSRIKKIIQYKNG